MPRRLAWVPLLSACLAISASAQEPPDIVIESTVPPGDETHFFVEFEVPEGIAEIEVRHDDMSPANILDWGLDDPNGFRGWGGGNSEPAIVGIDAASRSYVPGPIPAGTWEVVVGKARIEETPAPYRIEIFLRTEPTLPAQPRTPYTDPGVLSDETRWYAGDLHVHSRESGDAPATMEESLQLARQLGLDFIMFSEHNTNSGLTYYPTLQDSFPDVLIIPGVEWTTYAGHGNALGATEWVDHKVGVRGATVAGAIQAYREQGAFFYPTHAEEPSWDLCLGCMWEYDVDPTTLDAVEVWTATTWDSIDYWEDQIREGSRAVALGGSDDHRAGQDLAPHERPIGSPMTMVYAENLSVEAILEGIRAGRTVVRIRRQDRPDPVLETTLSGERIGDTVFADTAVLSATVTGAEGTSLAVIKNGTELLSVDITSDPFTHELEVTPPPEGEDRYRHQVQAGAPLTLSSYVWLQAGGEVPDGGVPDGGTSPSSSGGCDCRVATPADADLAALLVVLVTVAWSTRRRKR